MLVQQVPDRVRADHKDVDRMTSFYDLTPDQLEEYKRLRHVTIEAVAQEHDFLNSLLPEPLDEPERMMWTAAWLPVWIPWWWESHKSSAR